MPVFIPIDKHTHPGKKDKIKIKYEKKKIKYECVYI